jgi:hypothetical protein
LALLGMVALYKSRRPRYEVVLWCAWLATGLVLFSGMGAIRAQYLEAIAAPLAVCSASGLVAVVEESRRRPRASAFVLVVCSLYSAALLATTADTAWMGRVLVAIAMVSSMFLVRRPRQSAMCSVIIGFSFVLVAYGGPFVWSVATALEPQTGSAARYPIAGPDDLRRYPTAPGGDLPMAGDVSDPVITYLEGHSPRSRYLVMTERSLFGDAARYITTANRGVLTLDSYGDEATAARSVAALVHSGDLRFLELPVDGPWTDSQLALGQWFLSHCTDVTSAALAPLDGSHLFDCAPG